MKFVYLLLIVFSFISCENNDEVVQTSIEINIPLNKKAVYLYQSFIDSNNVRSLEYSEIYSIIYTNMYKLNDTTYYEGKMEWYIPDQFAGINLNYDSASIKLSIDNNWVLFQYSDKLIGERFLKQKNNLKADTTFIPTDFLNQFPIIPKILTTNSSYSIYRPAGNNFTGVNRSFKTRDSFISSFNSTSINCSIEHVLLDFLIDFNIQIDQNGIISSVYIEPINLVVYPPLGDPISALFTVTNTRIVDFTESGNIADLLTYY